MTYPHDVYMSPRKAVERITRLVNRCHPEAAGKGNNNYREEKEALIAATVLFGIEKDNEARFWLQNAEHIVRDFDISIIGWSKTEPDRFEPKAMWQIAEFESHTENLLDVITKKQSKVSSPEKMDLIISARDKEGWTFIPDQLSEAVKATGTKYRSVWLVCGDGKSEDIYHVIQLAPDVKMITYSIGESLSNAESPDYVRIGPRFLSNDLQSEEFEMDLPPCPVCKAA